MNVNTIALWRYQIIAPLLSANGPRGARIRLIREICLRTHEHPLRGSIRLGTRTVQEWLYDYLKDGLDGLLPVPRKDRGKSRRIDPELAAKIEALARGHPELDGPGLLAELRASGLPAPSRPTLYRFLRARGLDHRGAPPRIDHRAYEFDLAGDCWQGDVMFGPTLAQSDGSRRKTYLIAILDDATRLICHAQFYFEQHLTALKDCLKQALMKRGLPRRFYFDNGRIFRSRALLQVAASLSIQLIHTRPYKPQGRAKLERWFLTVRTAFLRRLDTKSLTDLGHLNRLLFAWIEGEYQVAEHRGIDGQTPLDRWMRRSESIRALPRDIDLDQLFLEQARRHVSKDGTLSMKGKRFEAGPFHIGKKLDIRFDPFDLRRIWYVADDGALCEIFPVDLAGNRRIKRVPQPPEAPQTPPLKLRSLEHLLRRQSEELF